MLEHDVPRSRSLFLNSLFYVRSVASQLLRYVKMPSLSLPRHKGDTETAEQIVAAGMPSIEPLLGGLLEWFQDYNWPVARALEPVLNQLGEEVVPHVRDVFESDDHTWKYWMIVVVIPKLTDAAQEKLRPDIVRMADKPAAGEVAEEVQLEVMEYLEDNPST